jgi:hypothetical protein
MFNIFAGTVFGDDFFATLVLFSLVIFIVFALLLGTIFYFSVKLVSKTRIKSNVVPINLTQAMTISFTISAILFIISVFWLRTQ